MNVCLEFRPCLLLISHDAKTRGGLRLALYQVSKFLQRFWCRKALAKHLEKWFYAERAVKLGIDTSEMKTALAALLSLCWRFFCVLVGWKSQNLSPWINESLMLAKRTLPFLASITLRSESSPKQRGGHWCFWASFEPKVLSPSRLKSRNRCGIKPFEVGRVLILRHFKINADLSTHQTLYICLAMPVLDCEQIVCTEELSFHHPNLRSPNWIQSSSFCALAPALDEVSHPDPSRTSWWQRTWRSEEFRHLKGSFEMQTQWPSTWDIVIKDLNN